MATPMLTAPCPIRIDADAYYRYADVVQMTGLTPDQIQAERRSGRLRMTQRRREYYVRGSWLLAWLDGDDDQ